MFPCLNARKHVDMLGTDMLISVELIVSLMCILFQTG